MKYTRDEVQQVIDDLNYAQAFHSEDESGHNQVRRSLKHASSILTSLPDDVIESLNNEVGKVFV